MNKLARYLVLSSYQAAHTFHDLDTPEEVMDELETLWKSFENGTAEEYREYKEASEALATNLHRVWRADKPDFPMYRPDPNHPVDALIIAKYPKKEE